MRILRASKSLHADFCDLILLGNPAKIAEICQAEGIELPSSIRIIDIENNEYPGLRRNLRRVACTHRVSPSRLLASA